MPLALCLYSALSLIGLIRFKTFRLGLNFSHTCCVVLKILWHIAGHIYFARYLQVSSVQGPNVYALLTLWVHPSFRAAKTRCCPAQPDRRSMCLGYFALIFEPSPAALSSKGVYQQDLAVSRKRVLSYGIGAVGACDPSTPYIRNSQHEVSSCEAFLLAQLG